MLIQNVIEMAKWASAVFKSQEANTILINVGLNYTSVRFFDISLNWRKWGRTEK